MSSVLSFLFFFFSSRRRHTRCLSDWSSDVCSSDLNASLDDAHSLVAEHEGADEIRRFAKERRGNFGARPDGASADARGEIGRASCRERVEREVGGGGWSERKEHVAWVGTQRGNA